MDVYVFQAALYCSDCGERLIDELLAAGAEDTGDADDFPQGPYADGGGEADSPQHCDAGPDCLAAEEHDGRRVGAFLENPLTHEGLEALTRALLEPGGAEDPIVRAWADFYGADVPTGEEDGGDDELASETGARHAGDRRWTA